MPKRYSPVQFRDSFWARVDKSGDCWLWKGSVDSHGYGTVRSVHFPREQNAHRIAWLLLCGPLAGEYVLHRCDVPLCVNPAHLFLGDHATNMADKVVKGRQSRLPGGLNGNAKLTPKQVAEIRSITTRGYGDTSRVSRWFGISRSCVTAIWKGTAWP